MLNKQTFKPIHFMKIFQKHEIHDFMSTNSYIVNLNNFMQKHYLFYVKKNKNKKLYNACSYFNVLMSTLENIINPNLANDKENLNSPYFTITCAQLL